MSHPLCAVLVFTLSPYLSKAVAKQAQLASANLQPPVSACETAACPQPQPVSVCETAAYLQSQPLTAPVSEARPVQEAANPTPSGASPTPFPRDSQPIPTAVRQLIAGSDLVIFHPLDSASMRSIVSKHAEEARAQLAHPGSRHPVQLHVDASAAEWLAHHGYSAAQGAVPLQVNSTV